MFCSFFLASGSASIECVDHCKYCNKWLIEDCLLPAERLRQLEKLQFPSHRLQDARKQVFTNQMRTQQNSL